MKKANIALIGFMGTGKSTIGQLLSEELKYDFVDTDKYIEEELKMSINGIFYHYGEEFFREKETEVLKEIIKKEGQIISTGGGLVIKEENRRLLMDNCFVVSLHATPQNIYFRIKDNKDRPLLNTAHPLKSIKKILHNRYKYYKTCHFFIRTDENSIGNIVEIITQQYGNYMSND